MSAVLLSHPARHWVCPNCTNTEISYEPAQIVITKMHNCKGLKGLSAPMVPEGIDCKVEAREREDYLGRDIAQTDGDGTPMMSVVTTRNNGEDCAVLASTAVNAAE